MQTERRTDGRTKGQTDMTNSESLFENLLKRLATDGILKVSVYLHNVTI